VLLALRITAFWHIHLPNSSGGINPFLGPPASAGPGSRQARRYRQSNRALKASPSLNYWLLVIGYWWRPRPPLLGASARAPETDFFVFRVLNHDSHNVPQTQTRTEARSKKQGAPNGTKQATYLPRSIYFFRFFVGDFQVFVLSQ
jgi:hypothetical protein